MNTASNNTKKQYTGLTVYGVGDSAMGFAPLEHHRENEETGEDKMMGFKLKITATPDTFKTSHNIYIEEEEMLNFIMVLLGYKDEMSAKRNAKISGTNKSFSLKVSNGEVYAKMDVQNSDKLSFKITNLNKMVLLRMVEDILILEIKRTTNIAFNRVDLKEYLLSVLKSNKVQPQSVSKPVQTVETVPASGNNEEIVLENVSEDTGTKTITYVNSYGGKDYVNKVEVSTGIYEKCGDIGKMDSTELNSLVSEIKEGNDSAKFLNMKNVKTIKRA